MISTNKSDCAHCYLLPEGEVVQGHDHSNASNYERMLASKLKYSMQARLILENFPATFPFYEFEQWVERDKFVVGGGYILEFLELRAEKAENEINKLTGLKDVL